MKATLNDFKVVIIWSVVAYLLVTIIGSLLFYFTGFSLLLIPVIAAGAVGYGFCSFKAANQLKGKTKLSWLNVTILFAGLIWFYGLLLNRFLLGLGYGSGNIVGIAASFVGVYVSHKTASKKK